MAKAKLGSGARFKSVTKSVMKSGLSENAAKAVAASIGRKKLGDTKMAELAAAGRRRAAAKKK